MDKPSITRIPVVVLLRQETPSGKLTIYSVASADLVGQEVSSAIAGESPVQVLRGQAKITDPFESEAMRLLREIQKLIANDTINFSKTPDHGTRDMLRKVEDLVNPAIPMDAKLKSL